MVRVTVPLMMSGFTQVRSRLGEMVAPLLPTTTRNGLLVLRVASSNRASAWALL